MASVIQIIKSLKKFKDLEKITKGKWDGEEIEIVNHDVDLHADRIEVDCTFKFKGNQHNVHAIHPWKSSAGDDEVKVDGQDVEQDDVDLDLDSYPLKNKIELEYRLEYTKDGQQHTLVLTASAKLSSFLPV